MSAVEILSPASDLAPGTTCHGRRVDWLAIAFRVELDADVLASFVSVPRERAPRGASFRARAELARKWRTASVSLPFKDGTGERRDFAMKMIGESKTILTNRDCRVVILEKAPTSPGCEPGEPGWTVSVECSGTGLLAMGWRRAAREAWALAGALGVVVEARIRRLDLCADFAGFPMPLPEGHGWCTRPQLKMREMHRSRREHIPRRVRKERAKVGRELLKRFEDGDITDFQAWSEMPDIDECYYFPADNCTGWKFGHGSISARVYDKHAEMRKRAAEAGEHRILRHQAEEKKAAEERWWMANGWDGKGVIVRVECQVRGDVLHELDARCDAGPDVDADAFTSAVGYQLDRVWRYFAGADIPAPPPPPTDANGKCVVCKVKHGRPEACPEARPPRTGWLRQVELERLSRGKNAGRARPRSECPSSDTWRAVQAVTFERADAEVPRRTRKCSGIRQTQILGSLLSGLAFVERLEHPRSPLREDVFNGDTGEFMGHEIVYGEDVYAEAVVARSPDTPKVTVERVLRTQVHDLYQQAADELVDTLLIMHPDKPDDALAFLWVRQNAALARWSGHTTKPARVLYDERFKPPPEAAAE